MGNTDNYIYVLTTYYDDPESLIHSAIKDKYHLLWHICKGYAAKMLICNSSWEWLATRIDDFSLLVTKYMCKRLPVWIWKSKFELGSLYHALDSIEKTINWLMNRWVSIIKNLFDPRYSYHIPSSFLISFDEDHMSGNM